MPKLQTSCSTPVSEGMVVHTTDPESVEGRAGVFEFLLINHPLDCPVCDKGGECPLQDFSHQFGNAESRMDFPRRTFDGEGVKADVDFGPTLMLNRNRCIMCTRCERFMREVDGDAQIGIINRGNGTEIATFNEEGDPLPAFRQPDGRLSGRGHHHPAVSIPIPSVGQPARGRHHVHAVLEGLQHHRVAQGQARVGKGLAPDPRDATLQPGRQRLLDVRHRALPVPVGGGRAAASPAASADQGRSRAGRDLERRAGEGPGPVERGRPEGRVLGAHARLGARVDRGALSPQAVRPGHEGGRRRRARARGVEAQREAAAGGRRSSRCQPPMRPISLAPPRSA